MTPDSIPANKSLGQHWLFDIDVLEDIVEFAGVGASDTVLEIGPGPGGLTRVLINRGVKVVAVEFDKALAEALPKRVVSSDLLVVNEDILRFDLTELPDEYHVVANVPYYITSKIIQLLLEHAHPPKSATLLVQKEVAERIAAAPGDMSLMSVAAQFYSDISLGPVVPAKLFSPPPKVDSQVIKLDYIGARYQDIDAKAYFRVVKAGFAGRRKKLRSSLAGGLHLSKERADELLGRAGIHPDARAQELSLKDWRALTASL